VIAQFIGLQMVRGPLWYEWHPNFERDGFARLRQLEAKKAEPDRISGLKRKLRGTRMPIVLGIPFGLTIETVPTHLPLPATIRTELLDAIHLDNDPERVHDREYVDSIYLEVKSAIQDAMDRLAKQRLFPIFGSAPSNASSSAARSRTSPWR
jgi:hypothetical protein